MKKALTVLALAFFLFDILLPFLLLALVVRLAFIMPVWKAWLLPSVGWLAWAYTVGHLYYYTASNYFLLVVALLPFYIFGRVPLGVPYEQRVTPTEVWVSYYLMPPLVFVGLPVLLIHGAHELHALWRAMAK